MIRRDAASQTPGANWIASCCDRSRKRLRGGSTASSEPPKFIAHRDEAACSAHVPTL